MTKEQYKEMVKDIVNNGAEYEYIQHKERNVINGWKDFDITDGYNPECDYRKKPPVTWLKNHLDSLDDRLNGFNEKDKNTCKALVVAGIVQFYREYRNRLYQNGKEFIDSDDGLFSPDYVDWRDIEDVANGMGITGVPKIMKFIKD